MQKKKKKKSKNTISNKPKKFTGKMQASLLLVFCVIVIVLIGLVVRLFIIKEKTDYAQKALAQQTYISSDIPYKRGSILDRNGTVLARSEKVYNLILDPRVLLSKETNVDPTIRALTELYGLNEGDLRRILQEKPDSAYVVLLKQLSYEQKTAFYTYCEKPTKEEDKGKIKGVWFEEEYLRTYPFGTLASHVIGFTVAGNEGNYGIEQRYNEELNGTNGRIYGYYDAELNIQQTEKPAVDGNTIISTIDANLQRIVQEKVEAFLDEIGAKNVGVLMMDVNTGGVLAMQSNYSYDLNNPQSLTNWYTEEEIKAMSNDERLTNLYSVWRNFCLSDTYEPGSTFKPFTVAAALEEQFISMDDDFYCDGVEMVGGWPIRCNNRSGHGHINLAQSIMFSCNDALMEMARRMDRSYFYTYQKHFLFGEKSGIDLPGEAVGLLIPESNLNASELATSSFGQSFTTTMIQLGSAFCSLVNGGYYYEPHVVKEIQNAEGATIQKIEPKVIVQSVSAETSELLKDALYLTVSDGTAKAAQVAGYLVGGKTGTAQKYPRSEGKYLVSFIGCVPADDPQVMIYVAIDEAADPTLQDKASISSALASSVLAEALPYLKIYPDGEIDYTLFAVKEEDIPMQEGTGADGEVQYDPSRNEESAEALPGEM